MSQAEVPIPRRPMLHWWVAFYALVIGHFAVIIGMVISFFILPFLQPWYVALPLDVWIFNLTFSREECKLTRLENYIRKKLGIKQIGGFVGHYIVRRIFPKKVQQEA